MTRFAVDTSVAIPLVLESHVAHASTTVHVGKRKQNTSYFVGAPQKLLIIQIL